MQDVWDGTYGLSSLSQIVTLKAGLKITVNQRTMSCQNGNVTALKLHSTVILTGLAYSHSWTHSQILNPDFLSLCKNTNRNLHRDLSTFLPSILTGETPDLMGQKFLWPVIVSGHPKIISSPERISSMGSLVCTLLKSGTRKSKAESVAFSWMPTIWDFVT